MDSNITYGRLLESVHVSGYTMERACFGLEALLEDDRWKEVGPGFERIDDFLKSVDLSQFKIAVDRRKKLARKLEDMQATQRATAKALGVSQETVRRDITPDTHVSKQGSAQASDSSNLDTYVSPRPTPLSVSGTAAAQTVEKDAATVARREQQEAERNQKRAEIAAQGAAIEPDDRWNIYHADMRTWTAPRRYDFIITDPPYPKEYLYLWEALAEHAVDWLKPGGLLIAMSGQSYLDEIYSMLSGRLRYYWTATYLTPGQPTPLRQVNVNTTWKPLLIYCNGDYSGKTFGDVFKSDGNDKANHKWGQSESGMIDIVSKMCLPGQAILDPFCGAGTTGVAALKNGCLFDGVESDEQNVNISKGRLSQ